MSEFQAVKANFAAQAAADDPAPGKSLWRRLEPTLLGAGTILVLLLVWEFLPRVMPMREGTKLFFTVPSQVAGTLYEMFASGMIWAPLGVSALAFAVGLLLAIAAGLPLGI